MNIFKRLGISDPIMRVIEEEGFKKPTKIQELSIPMVLSGKDVIAGSATGSGKTFLAAELGYPMAGHLVPLCLGQVLSNPGC